MINYHLTSQKPVVLIASAIRPVSAGDRIDSKFADASQSFVGQAQVEVATKFLL